MLNEKMEHIMKIVKSLKESKNQYYKYKELAKQLNMKQKNKTEDFLEHY